MVMMREMQHEHIVSMSTMSSKELLYLEVEEPGKVEKKDRNLEKMVR